METDLVNQMPHLQGAFCVDRMDSEAKILDFSRSGDPPHPLPLFLLPSLGQAALLGFASPGFHVKRHLSPLLWVGGGGREGSCCNPALRCWLTSDDVCIPLLLAPAGGGSPGWTGRVVLLRGGLPALQQTAWGGQGKRTKAFKNTYFIEPQRDRNGASHMNCSNLT